MSLIMNLLFILLMFNYTPLTQSHSLRRTKKSLWTEDFAKVTQGNDYKAIGDIGFARQSDLKRILESKLNREFLTKFPRWIIPYELSTATDDTKEEMRKTLSTVAEKNLYSEANGGTLIEIMISISLKDDISDNLNKIYDIITDTNLKFPKTISKLLIHYGSLRLDPGAVSVVRQDIDSCNRFVKAHNNGVTCGFVFDAKNCAGYEENKLMFLPFNENNLIILDPRDENIEGFIVRLLLFITCIKIALTKAVVGIRLPVTVHVDLITGRYYQEFKNEDKLNWGYKYHVKNIEIIYGNVRNESKTLSRHVDLTEEWLRRPLELRKDHVGVTIHSSTLPASELTMSKVFDTFHTIVLDSPGGPSTAELNRQYDFAKTIATYLRKLNTDITTNNGNIFPIQVMLSVPIHHDSFITNKQVVDAAISAAVAANKVYPVIVTALLFDWTSCLKSESCEPLKGDDAISEYVNTHFELLELIFKYAVYARKKVKLVDTLKLGIIFEKEFVHDTDLYQLGSHTFVHAAVISKADLLVYKITVDKTQIFKQGALQLAQSLIPKLIPLHDILRYKVLYAERPIPMSAMYKIKIAGCGDGKDIRPSSERQTEVVEYVRFWELINKWTILTNATVIIDTAFEESENIRQTRCRYDNNPFKSPKGCACGWWKISRNNRTAEQDVTLTDKKTIALQIYNEGKKAPKVVTPPENFPFWIVSVIIVPGLVMTLLLGVLAAYLGKYHGRKSASNVVPTKKDINGFFNGGTDQLGHLQHVLTVNSHSESLPYQKEKYELESSSFKIGTNCLGKGEFGVVLCGTIKRANTDTEKTVAVKMISKDKSSSRNQSHGKYLALKGLISEIKLLSYIGEHGHIVKLEGAYTKQLKKGVVIVFLEFCELGSLEKYLHSLDPTDNADETSPEPELFNDLLRWAEEIACGMEFLVSKKVVHADLATRNVLLNSQKSVKISDFGLSRRLYDYSEYLKTDPGPLPWRWMAPESLRKQVFNEKTDVWSFGVTLWEIYTLGDIPYSGLSWEVDFTVTLEVGVRLPEPRYNQNSMYTIMKQCWNAVPAERPDFSALTLLIKNEAEKVD